MDKPSTSGQSQSTGRRVRLIPATPRPEGIVLPASQSVVDPKVGISQPPDTFGGDLYSRLINEAMAKLRNYGSTTEETSSSKNSSKSATLPSLTSSSSLRFSDGRTFEEITSETIREMREIDEKKERKSRESQGAGGAVQIPSEATNRGNQGNPIREIYDLTGTNEEEVVTSDDWRSRMEETVDMFVIENAEPNAMLKAQREQMTKMVYIVDTIIPDILGFFLVLGSNLAWF